MTWGKVRWPASEAARVSWMIVVFMVGSLFGGDFVEVVGLNEFLESGDELFALFCGE